MFLADFKGPGKYVAIRTHTLLPWMVEQSNTKTGIRHGRKEDIHMQFSFDVFEVPDHDSEYTPGPYGDGVEDMNKISAAWWYCNRVNEDAPIEGVLPWDMFENLSQIIGV